MEVYIKVQLSTITFFFGLADVEGGRVGTLVSCTTLTDSSKGRNANAEVVSLPFTCYNGDHKVKV